VRAIDVRALLAEATLSLERAGVGSPRVDAELLLAFVLGVERGRLLLVDDVTDSDRAAYEALLVRRAAREPLQHLTGRAPFRHLEVEVGPGVFIPRPESELLVDAALVALRGLARPVVVDLCSGSGAIALAIADEVPSARVFAVELHRTPLAYLHRNVVGTGVTVFEGDVADPSVLAGLNATADVVISNPPYVPTTVEVSPEVRHDPPEAIFAGADGLALMPYVLQAAFRLLRPGGLLVVEHDDGGSGNTLVSRLESMGWLGVTAGEDLSGRARYVTARRPMVDS
jgi:release factor glutamine methyltransferase